jgi:hypothetical protein
MSSQYDLTILTYQVIFYSCILIGAIGLVTNLLNIVISQRKKMTKKTTMGIYNTYMSVLNIMTIIFAAFLTTFPQSISNVELLTSSVLSCKLIPYFTRIFSQCVAWSNVLIAFDRMIVVFFSTRNWRYLNVINFVKFFLLINLFHNTIPRV